MTDFQYKSILKSVKLILDGCKDIAEAQAKIDILLEEGEGGEKSAKDGGGNDPEK